MTTPKQAALRGAKAHYVTERPKQMTADNLPERLEALAMRVPDADEMLLYDAASELRKLRAEVERLTGCLSGELPEWLVDDEAEVAGHEAA